MTWPDLINGLYETGAGLFLALSCIKLYHDKEVKGWSLLTQLFFTTWSYWNLYYYPNLNQWISFFGGLVVVISNTVWTTMAFYYTKKNKKEKQIFHG